MIKIVQLFGECVTGSKGGLLMAKGNIDLNRFLSFFVFFMTIMCLCTTMPRDAAG